MYTTITTKHICSTSCPWPSNTLFFLFLWKCFWKDLLYRCSGFALKSLRTVLGNLMHLLQNIFSLTYFLIAYKLQLQTWTLGLNTYSLWKMWSELKTGSEFCENFAKVSCFHVIKLWSQTCRLWEFSKLYGTRKTCLRASFDIISKVKYL